MPDRHELENLIRGIDAELDDCRRDWKEADCVGDDEVKRDIDQNVAALKDQRQQAGDSLERLGVLSIPSVRQSNLSHHILQ